MSNPAQNHIDSILSHPSLKGFDRSVLEVNLLEMGNAKVLQLGPEGAAKHLKDMMAKVAQPTVSHSSSMEQFIKSMQQAAPEVEKASFQALRPDTKVRAAKPQSSKPFFKFDKMTGEEKLYAGMSLLVATMSFAGAFSYLGQALQKDEQGKTQIQWSNVGMGMVNAAFAAGSLYYAHQAMAPSAGR